MLVLVLVLFLG